MSSSKKKDKTEDAAVTAKDETDFKTFDGIVRKGVAAYMECGAALREIHGRKLWRVAGHKTWEEYCRKVVGISKPYAHRIVRATEISLELQKSLPIGNDSKVILPIMETQVRPLQQLEDPEKRAAAWKLATCKAGGQPTQLEVTEAVFEILDPLAEKPKPESRSAKRSEIVAQLLRVAREKSSWDEVERLVARLNDLE